MATMMVDQEILEAAHWLAVLGSALHGTFSVSKGKQEEEEELVMVKGNEEEKKEEDEAC